MLRRAAILLGLMVALAIAIPSGVSAEPVIGWLLELDGHPASGRQIHFQNNIASDIYIADTAADGAFRADLPPGIYSLRDANGAVLRSGIAVSNQPVNLRHVAVLSPHNWRRYFERQEIGEALLKSPAPSTANLYTEDVNFYGTFTQPAPLRASRLYRAQEPLPGLVNPNLPNQTHLRGVPTPGATLRQMPAMTPPRMMPNPRQRGPQP